MADEAAPTTEPVTTATETPAPAAAPAKPAPALDRVAAFLAKQGEAAPADGDEGDEPAAEAAAAEAPAEGEPPAEKKPPEKIPDMAAQRRSFAALSKREKALRSREADFTAAREKAQRFDSIGTRLLAEPDVVIAELLNMPGQRAQAMGRFLDAHIARGGSAEAAEPTEADRIAALEKTVRDRDAELQRAEYNRVVDGNKVKVRDAITAAGAKFDLINASDAHDQVWDAMVAYYGKHKAEIDKRGITLNPLDFAEVLEREMEAAEDARLSRSTKFGRRPTNKQAPSAGLPTVATPAATAKTLTNGNVSTGTAPRNGVTRETLEQRQVRVRREMNLTQ